MSKIYLKMFFPDVPMASVWMIWVDGKRVLRVNSITFVPKNETVWDFKLKERRVRGGTMRYTSFEADVRIETGEFGLKDIYLERKYGEYEDETENGSNNE